jgi:hypothetical protein
VLRGNRARWSGTRRSPPNAGWARDGGTHLGLRSTAPSFAGGCGTGGLCGWRSRVRAGHHTRCSGEMRKGQPSSSSAREHDREVRGGQEEGTRFVERRAGLRSVRPVCMSLSHRPMGQRMQLVVHVVSHPEPATNEREVERTSPSTRSTRIRRPAVGARTSSVCRSREVLFGPRETRPRARVGRKPARVPGRVDGGLTHEIAVWSAQATRAARGNGRWIQSERGNPSSREATRRLECPGFVRALSRAKAGSSSRWKALRTEDADGLSRGPRRIGPGSLLRWKRATRASEASRSIRWAEENAARAHRTNR